MWIPCGLCLVVFFAISVNCQNDVRKPPSITYGPQRTEIFVERSTVTLPCKADGTPDVTYVWKMNGQVIDLNRAYISQGADGNITINQATRKDDGFYQCLATNEHGTALSAAVHVQGAFLDSVLPTEPFNVIAQEGRPFVVPGTVRNCFPAPEHYWETATRPGDMHPRKYHESKRVTLASNGDLYFAYAEKADEQNGRLLCSHVFNSNMNFRSGGYYTKVTVEQGSEPPPDFPPNVTYFSQSQEVALIGGFIELRCFFSGKPLPDITWTGPGNHLPPGRSSIPSSHYQTLLNISSVSESDEGEYICTAKNAKGTASYTHNVRVEAVPIFKEKYDGPRDVNVTEGDSITFNCSAYAKPEATVVWYQNGQPIDVKNAPKRFLISDDLKSLTIRDVCRDCDDRETKTDLMVIQCNASNVHGYAFASGYLNVLLRTKLTLHFDSTLVNSITYNVSVDLTKDNLIQFDCRATSDPSTPPTVRWYKVKEIGEELVYSEQPYVNLVNGNLALYTEANCSAACEKYLGEYRCDATNNHTRDSVTVMLNATKAPVYEEVITRAGLNWIVIGAATVLFLLLLMIICYIVCRLRNSDEYDVDGKERKSGRNPQEEIRANGFQDYYPSNGVQRPGSVASPVRSSRSTRGLEDADEYDDYHEHFREDGSFVGKYS